MVGPTVSTGAILFTDMVGSTELRSRLGDDRADMLRRHHDELLAAAVDAHQGVVLRWTGDGIKAAFATSSDAVAAAVDMQRAVAEYGATERAIAPFQVRIGLGAGELLIDDGDHHGVAVIEAARLEAMARPGEILATEVVRVLGHRRSTVTFEEIGERSLKGLEAPVMVHRVVDLTVATVPDLPRVVAGDRRLPLVGRDRHLQTFRAAWADARAGSAGLVLVSSAAGLGKTRLASHFAELAHSDGALVLAGVCDSELGVPYEPFAMALREVAGLDDALDRAVTARSGPLARLFPGSTSSHAESQPAMARFELFGAVVALLRRLSLLHPVLLVLDDLHWATAPTTLLLAHLVDELADARVLVVAAARDDDLEPAHPLRDLVAAVRSLPQTTRIDLLALTEADVMEMVAAAAPSAPIARVADVAQQVHRESAGSPYYASELLHHLSVTGQLDRALDGTATGALPIPDSVHDVVAQRLARLPAGSSQVLTFAAVIGPMFELDLLADVVDRNPDDVLDLLDEVTRAGMVTEVGIDQFAFSHAIVRSVLLDELSATRRARAHRRVAEALEARGAEQIDELARHWQLAGAASKSAMHLARAARRDMVALAYESARTKYQQVVELLSHDPHADALARAEAWLGLGAAARALGDPTYTQAVSRAARLARTARNPQLMAEAAALSVWPGTFFFIAELPDTELIELCEDALTLLADTDPLRVRVLSTLASHLTFAADVERRVELIEQAGRLAAQHDDPLLFAATLNAEFLCLWEPATLPRREQIARELGRIARSTGDPETEFLSGFFTAYCQVESGELTTSRARLIELEPLAAATKNHYFEFLTERLLLSIDIARCEPTAKERVDALLQRFADTHADTDGTWALQTGGLALHAGTLDQMLNAIESMTASNQARTWTAAHALALMLAGRRDEADEILDRYADTPRNYFWVTVSQVRAEVAAGLGRRDHCAQLYRDLLPYRGQLGITASGSLVFGLVSRTLGMLALALDDLPSAIELLRDATRHADRIGAPFEAVASRRLMAQALIATNEWHDVAGLIDTALATARQQHFAREAALLDQLHAELATKSRQN